MKEELKARGWVQRGGVMVYFGKPRLGWKDDGTLIIGYHEFPRKVYTIDELEQALNDYADKDIYNH